MSYSCYISFKKMNEKDIIPFFKNFKKTTTERLEAIAQKNHNYVPYLRNGLQTPPPFKEITHEQLTEAKYWARACMFQYKYFYDTKNKLLCVFGVPDCMQDLFDKTVYFQNSCDQDYERKEWEGVEAFEKIFDKWHTYSDTYVKRRYKQEYLCSFDKEYRHCPTEKQKEKLDYHRRSFAYDEIWAQLSNALYCDEEAIFLSLYGGYEIAEMTAFVKYCHEANVAWHKKMEEEWKKRN